MKNNRFIITGLLCAILFFSSIPVSYSEVDNVYWQLVYVTGNSKCSPTETTKTNEFFGVTEKYFEMYRFSAIGSEPKCTAISDLSKNYFQKNIQLVIIIFDDFSGKNLLTKNGYEGFYSHLGDNRNEKHTIMIKDSPNFDSYYDSTDTAWLLSNHLSKFILYYKGYSQQEIQRVLQPIEMQYDKCVGFEYTNNSCDAVRTTIKPSKIGKYFLIMTPLEKAVGNKSLKHLPSDLTTNETILNLQREITTWWINDKITNDDYLKSLKYLVDAPPPVNNTKNISSIDLPNGFIMIDLIKKKTTINQPSQFQAFAIDSDTSNVFSYIPFEADNLKEDSSEIPDWFKLRAKLWSERRISDMIFFDGLESLIRINIK